MAIKKKDLKKLVIDIRNINLLSYHRYRHSHAQLFSKQLCE